MKMKRTKQVPAVKNKKVAAYLQLSTEKKENNLQTLILLYMYKPWNT